MTHWLLLISFKDLLVFFFNIWHIFSAVLFISATWEYVGLNDILRGQNTIWKAWFRRKVRLVFNIKPLELLYGKSQISFAALVFITAYILQEVCSKRILADNLCILGVFLDLLNLLLLLFHRLAHGALSPFWNKLLLVKAEILNLLLQLIELHLSCVAQLIWVHFNSIHTLPLLPLTILALWSTLAHMLRLLKLLNLAVLDRLHEL